MHLWWRRLKSRCRRQDGPLHTCAQSWTQRKVLAAQTSQSQCWLHKHLNLTLFYNATVTQYQHFFPSLFTSPLQHSGCIGDIRPNTEPFCFQFIHKRYVDCTYFHDSKKEEKPWLTEISSTMLNILGTKSWRSRKLKFYTQTSHPVPQNKPLRPAE